MTNGIMKSGISGTDRKPTPMSIAADDADPDDRRLAGRLWRLWFFHRRSFRRGCPSSSPRQPAFGREARDKVSLRQRHRCIDFDFDGGR